MLKKLLHIIMYGFPTTLDEVFQPLTVMTTRAKKFLEQVSEDKDNITEELNELSVKLSELQMDEASVKKLLSNLNKLIY